MPTPKDFDWMLHALRLAEYAAEADEVPVGAVVVYRNSIVGEGWNRPVTSADPTAHAEIVALRAAAQSLGNYRLPACDLYVTLEPCTMCAGAIVHARIRRLVYGATEPKAGVVDSRNQLLDAAHLNHRVVWEGGVCAEQSADLLQTFFQRRREARRKQ